jgi:hypothetical protein
MDFKRAADIISALVRGAGESLPQADRLIMLEIERELRNMSKVAHRDINSPYKDSKGKTITVRDDIAVLISSIARADYALRFDPRYAEEPLKSKTERDIEILEKIRAFYEENIALATAEKGPAMVIPGKGRLVN